MDRNQDPHHTTKARSSIPTSNQLKDILQKTTQFLKDKGSPSARLDTEILFASVLKWDRVKLYTNYEYPLTEDQLEVARGYVRRRAAGEPVAYILGCKDFYNQSFKVSNSVLIPRPETETIVETVLELASNEAEIIERVVDIGTGSGCIGLSLLAEIPDLQLLAVDISEAAITVAKENAEKLEVGDRAKFLAIDAAKLGASQVEQALGGLADIIVANPPYIDPDDPEVEDNVKKFEPQQALFAPDHGLGCIREWAKAAVRIARPDAFVMFEIGAAQGADATQLFEATNGYRDVEVIKDLSGRDRFIMARVASREE